MFAYPFGANHGGSVLTSICVAMAAWVLIRRDCKSLLVMFAAIFGLAFVAAALQKYPYGDNSRLVQYLAPIVCLMAGLGLANILAMAPKVVWRQRMMLSYVVMLFVMAGGIFVFDLLHPFKHGVDRVHQGFARWFWSQDWSDSQVICLKTDW